MVVVLVNETPRPFVDLKILAQPAWVATTCPFTVNVTVSVFCVELMMNNTTNRQKVS